MNAEAARKWLKKDLGDKAGKNFYRGDGEPRRRGRIWRQI